MRRRLAGGFTLLEVLLAMGLLALLSLMAYRSLDGMARTREQVAAHNERWREIALFFERVGQDLGQALQQAPGQASPGTRAWLRGESAATPEGTPLVVFSRRRLGGAPEAAMGYRLRDGQVEWLRWAMGSSDPVQSEVVLRGVTDLRLRYLDANGGWAPTWPPAEGEWRLPRAVALELTPREGPALSRVFALP